MENRFGCPHQKNLQNYPGISDARSDLNRNKAHMPGINSLILHPLKKREISVVKVCSLFVDVLGWEDSVVWESFSLKAQLCHIFTDYDVTIFQKILKGN